MKTEKKEKLILACIKYLGMTPDSAEFFVREFPKSAYWSVLNAKGRKVKVKHYPDHGNIQNFKG